MKFLNLFIFIFALSVISSCTGNEQQIEQELEAGYTKNVIANTRAIEDISPLLPNAINYENSDTLISENSNYRALNISFSTEETTIVRTQNSEGNYVNPVEVWQNIVEVTNKSTNSTSKFLVSLIPDFLYYNDHKFIEWSNFKHLDKRSDFSGYEVRTDWETGQILVVNYYYNGICLYHVKATDEVKYEFMKSIFELFGFQKVNLNNSNEDVLHKYLEDIFMGIYGYVKDIIKIRWSWITLGGADDEDHGDQPEDGSGVTGGGSNSGSSGGHNYNTNYSITGNETLFTSEIITHFAEHSFESSPCTIVSLALQYYNRNKSPLDILNEAKANNNGQLLYIYKNCFRTEDLEKVIGTNFTYKKCENVKNAINLKRPLFSVYHPTGSSNYVSAVLIVGYYGENLIIYNPDSDSIKSLNSGIFDMDETFELISVLYF